MERVPNLETEIKYGISPIVDISALRGCQPIKEAIDK